VHVVPATAEQPKTPTTPEQWLMREATVASLRGTIPLPPIPPRPRTTVPAANAVDVVPPIPSRLPDAPAIRPATTPTGPVTPAAKGLPGPRAEITDVTGAIKTDVAPVTTSNMPKSGIP
jgi:hypothetical protein